MTMMLVAVGALVALGAVGAVIALVLFNARKKPAFDDDADFASPPPAPAPAEPAAESVGPAGSEEAAGAHADAPPAAPVGPTLAPDDDDLPPEAAAPPLGETAADEARAADVAAAEAPVAEVRAADVAAVEAPAAEAPAVAPPAADAPSGLVQVEKLRIAELGVVLYVWALRLGDEDLLAFATDGFAARGREELVLYVRRSAVPDGDVVRNLKRFAGLALILLERVEPVKLGEVLKVPGEVGATPLGGYLAVQPAEPAPVPFGARFVLIGLPRRLLTGDGASVRAAVEAEAGGAPWLTSV